MKKLYLKLLQCGFAVVALALLLQQSPVASAKDHDITILPPSSHPYGRSYEEWSNAWYKWALSIPASVNPVTDTDGTYCHEGQKGRVWFLAGTFGTTPVTRHCMIPRGKALFFPLANIASFNIANSTPETEHQLREDLVPYLAVPHPFFARIDGESIPHLSKYLADNDGPVFKLHLPANNIIQPQPGFIYQAVSGGYYLMLAPLSPGKHTIHFLAVNNALGVYQDITYHLYVED